MGLDIRISVDNPENVFDVEYYTQESGYEYQRSLSRTFCNFICRKGVICEEPELDQIGRITGVTIVPIYDMELYCDEICIQANLEFMDTEEEKQAFIHQVMAENTRIEGNLDKVLNVINALIEALTTLHDLPFLLNSTTYDTLNNDVYFADFALDKGNGYINNNFGRDLRNFKRFLEYAKNRGTKTVYFSYG